MKTFFLVVSLFMIFANGKKLPSYVTRCKYNDPNINKCWKDVVTVLKPYMKKGIPEMSIPPCDPLVIPRLELTQPIGANVGFDAVLTDLSFNGGLNFEMNNIDVNLDKGKFYMEINFPELTMLGKYVAKGKVLLLNFEGEGIAHGKFGNVTLYASYNNVRETRKGKEHYIVKEKNTRVDISSIWVQFDNLFKNNPAITDNTNKLINENTDILFLEIKPIVEKTIGDLVTNVIESINHRYAITELFA